MKGGRGKEAERRTKSVGSEGEKKESKREGRWMGKEEGRGEKGRGVEVKVQ